MDTHYVPVSELDLQRDYIIPSIPTFDRAFRRKGISINPNVLKVQHQFRFLKSIFNEPASKLIIEIDT